MKITEVFAINQKCRNGVGGALPDCYLEQEDAIELARRLAYVGTESIVPRELPITEDDDEAIVFRITDEYNTFEVLRLRVAY